MQGNHRSWRGRAATSTSLGKRGGPPTWSQQLRTAPPALGSEMSRIHYSMIDFDHYLDVAEITDCTHVASYNLSGHLSKKILVPGRPPLWTPLSGTYRLQRDSGQYYRDENAARFPTYCLEPMVQSMLLMKPELRPSNINVVACASTLGNLLRFANDRAESFSFLVHHIGDTAFFVRREIAPDALIEGVVGHGNAFVEANTTWSRDVTGSGPHQRVVAYTLGNLKLLVRFEADCYIIEQADDISSPQTDAGAESSVDELSSLLEGRVKSRSVGTPTDSLIIERKGTTISHTSLVDVKTRSAFKDRTEVLADQIPRLWLRQLTNLVLSFHNKGEFTAPKVEDISTYTQDWENENTEVIARLIAITNEVRRAAAECSDGLVEVRYDGSSTLQINRVSGEHERWHAISKETQQTWAK